MDLMSYKQIRLQQEAADKKRNWREIVGIVIGVALFLAGVWPV